jgi:hypothetical protein
MRLLGFRIFLYFGIVQKCVIYTILTRVHPYIASSYGWYMGSMADFRGL